MSSDIDRTGLRPRFWERYAPTELTHKEWEALCDGCGKCCLNKLEDEDTGQVDLTCVSCRLLDDKTSLCSQYEIRHQFVPECIVLSPENMEKNLYWIPETCAYKLLWQGKPLYDWHPLISGDPQSVHRAGISMQNRTVPETEVHQDDWDDYIIEEPV
jgi:hypothetical protein